MWIALTYQGHVHHSAAVAWFASLSDSARLCFCRISQLSLLRLLTTQAVMGPDVMSQTHAWEVYDRWLADGRIVLLDEPVGLEAAFRMQSRRGLSAPRDWADSYLAAFAAISGLTLVTFDKAFGGRIRDLVLLKS